MGFLFALFGIVLQFNGIALVPEKVADSLLPDNGTFELPIREALLLTMLHAHGLTRIRRCWIVRPELN